MHGYFASFLLVIGPSKYTKKIVDITLALSVTTGKGEYPFI